LTFTAIELAMSGGVFQTRRGTVVMLITKCPDDKLGLVITGIQTPGSVIILAKDVVVLVGEVDGVDCASLFQYVPGGSKCKDAHCVVVTMADPSHF
jgi:hypothetical protein